MIETVRRAAALPFVVVAAIAVVAPAAHGFAGGDGAIVYGWSNFVEEEFEPFPILLDETAIRTIPPRRGEPATLRGCTKAAGKPDVGDCTIGYRDPAVSPSGRRVAFDAGASLALMRIDGSGFRLLPAHSEDDGEPAFSPAGKRLAFSAGASTAVFDPTPSRGVWISDLAGAQARRVTARGTAPAWSSRNWIAFLRADGIYRIRPDGRGLRRLVACRLCTDVAWSPRGTKLAFACRGRLLASGGDGSDLRRVAPSATALAWSPSGTRLAVSLFDGNLVTIRTDGSRERRLVSGGLGAVYRFGAGGVDWQPLH